MGRKMGQVFDIAGVNRLYVLPVIVTVPLPPFDEHIAFRMY